MSPLFLRQPRGPRPRRP